MIGDFDPVIDLLKKEIPGLAGVYLFGSEATGAARAGSDVDLAIFAGRPLGQPLLRETAEAIARLLLREVDLVDLAAVDTILQMQVLREGIVLAEIDPVALGHFELRVLRDYRDLKIRRAGIEADIVNRGRVYAG